MYHVFSDGDQKHATMKCEETAEHTRTPIRAALLNQASCARISLRFTFCDFVLKRTRSHEAATCRR
jgi:hypothetical protein